MKKVTQRKATPDDLRMLYYFWDSKEDIERYAGFKEIKQDLKENYPEILKAFKKYKKAIRNMSSVFNKY